ncbi:mannose-1-phosphate guanylyltransferase/mannose-6-phosphate isomerase [Hansschlegelia zhihuaiae]|uniref:mannose-1-phosphate guanylyltransferase n=1 Tax=Hansschlegelia zhihuaiae TaxID=405005 RepID=A0A4Q0MDE7_9HYPH|nr:mannose-1-phosphate guanylyltransferase/mannose-6-phosphate isomerase [Hansschlegelia zhihuaiae]RXF70949.1 mannose-1-phosphate guanylyltransferase/mannose-6-phosphate isomerase [Hansschlegelia zhihuaiae]
MVAAIRPLILSGGAGTRLWPTSRDTMPKQFVPLIGERSSFQETVLRVRGEDFSDRPIVVTNAAHRMLVERQLAEIEAVADLLLEPVRRNTGPAVLAGCCLIAEQDARGPVLVLAADHAMPDVAGFHAAVKVGLTAARRGRLVTFGIEPDCPATGYGYIEPGRELPGGGRTIDRFVEKPDAANAARLISAGALWNSGNFLFQAKAVIDEYDRLDRETLAAVREALSRADRQSGAVALDAACFGRAAKTSFDYAVMERTARAAVVSLSCGWNDIGSWDALWSLSSKDDDGNVPHGAVEFVDAHDCYVSSNGPVTSLLGVSNLVVVANKDAILVADRGRSGDVRFVVDALKARGRPEAVSHARVQRPWGWYESLEAGEGFQVKRIFVEPGGRLSLQTHRFRAEHWVVVRGAAHVTVGSEVRVLRPGEHAHIPLGEVHRLENFGNSPIELIEVQNGTYLGEDDIVRLEDVYRREAHPAAAAE